MCDAGCGLRVAGCGHNGHSVQSETSLMTEYRRRMTEVRGQKTDDRSQNTEDG